MSIEEKKWEPKPGQSILSIGSGIISFIIRVLTKILYRFPFSLILSHAAKVVDSKTSIEASTKGVSYYNLKKEYEKAKRVIVFEHPFYEVNENQEAFIQHCVEIVKKNEGYGFINYFLWYFATGIVYFPLVLFFAHSWKFRLILLGAFIIIYFPLSRIFKKIQVRTKICSELVSRIDQEKFGIELGCIDYEHFSPNDVWQSYVVSESWKVVTDFKPYKVKWSDHVKQGNKG